MRLLALPQDWRYGVLELGRQICRAEMPAKRRLRVLENATMKTGDVIEINTKYGSKGAKLIRDGVETDYFRYIDVDSTFMQLAIGDNMFRYDAASGVNSLEVSIFYSKEFLGV